MECSSDQYVSKLCECVAEFLIVIYCIQVRVFVLFYFNIKNIVMSYLNVVLLIKTCILMHFGWK